MSNVCYYISDYGYGHASRSIAVIRKMLREIEDVTVYVKAGFPADFLRRSLAASRAKVIDTRNDVGIVLKDHSVRIDAGRTLEALGRWAGTWDDYIRREEEFCRHRHVDMVLTDITPQPFFVSERLGIPGIAISNFTWYYIFSHMFGDAPAVRRMEEAYRLADLTLVLPFNEDMGYIRNKRPVSLTSRPITAGREEMRRKLGLSGPETLVYLGSGMSVDTDFLKNVSLGDRGWKLLVSSNSFLNIKNAVRIPPGETETQNYIGMCDLVVSKTGYSTVSEAIRARVPPFVFKREGFREDDLIAREVERMGVGRVLSEDDLVSGRWMDEADDLGRYSRNYGRLEKRYINDGAIEVVEAIEEFL